MDLHNIHLKLYQYSFEPFLKGSTPEMLAFSIVYEFSLVKKY